MFCFQLSVQWSKFYIHSIRPNQVSFTFDSCHLNLNCNRLIKHNRMILWPCMMLISAHQDHKSASLQKCNRDWKYWFYVIIGALYIRCKLVVQTENIYTCLHTVGHIWNIQSFSADFKICQKLGNASILVCSLLHFCALTQG